MCKGQFRNARFEEIMIRYIRHFAFHRYHSGSTMLDAALLLFVFFPLLLFPVVPFPLFPFPVAPIYIFPLFHVPLFPFFSVSSCASFPLLPYPLRPIVFLIPFVVVSSLLSVSTFRLHSEETVGKTLKLNATRMSPNKTKMKQIMGCSNQSVFKVNNS